MTGIGERSPTGDTNFFIVDKNTPVIDIEQKFSSYLARNDVAIIIITQKVIIFLLIKIASLLETVKKNTQLIPTIIQIPSKDMPIYDANVTNSV